MCILCVCWTIGPELDQKKKISSDVHFLQFLFCIQQLTEDEKRFTDLFMCTCLEFTVSESKDITKIVIFRLLLLSVENES